MADKPDLDILGVSGLSEYKGVIEEDVHRKLRGPEGHKVFREMAQNEPMLAGAVHGMTSLIQQTPWMARAPEDAGERGQEEAQFLESVIRDMSHTYQDFIADCATMVYHGFSLFEVVHKQRMGHSDDPSKRSKHDDGRYGIRKLAPRRQVTISRWEFDDDGGVRGAYQISPKTFKETFLPIERLAIFRVKPNQGNPEGQSMFLGSYLPYKYKQTLEKIRAIGYQKDLTGTIVATIPEEYMSASSSAAKKTIRANIEKQLALAHVNERPYILMPPKLDHNGNPTGWDVWLLASGGSRNVQINDAINDYKKDMVHPLMMEFMMAGMDRTGAMSLHSSMTDLFAVTLGAILDGIEETFNRFVVDPLYEINGVPEEYRARWVHGDIEKRDLREFAEFLLKAVDSGILTPDSKLEDFFREEASLPEIDEEERDNIDERIQRAAEAMNARIEAQSTIPQPTEQAVDPEVDS